MIRSQPTDWASAIDQSIIGRPPTGCSTFGKEDRIRVPCPAAKITAARFAMQLVNAPRVVLLLRPELAAKISSEDMDEVYGTAEVILGKQRHGPIGKVVLSFDANVTRFGNLARPSQGAFEE